MNSHTHLYMCVPWLVACVITTVIDLYVQLVSRSVHGPHAITYINIDTNMPHLYSRQSDHNYNHIALSYYRSSHAVQIVNSCHNLRISIVSS